MYSPFFDTAFESRRGAEIDDDAGPAELFEGRHAVDDAVGANFRRIVVLHRMPSLIPG